MLAGPSEDALICFPTRVVATPAGGSAYTFTMFQAPGQPDDQFENQHASLLRELENLSDASAQRPRADLTDEFSADSRIGSGEGPERPHVRPRPN